PGDVLVYSVLQALVWTASLGLLWLERHWVLAGQRFRGHGITLLLLWAASAIAELVVVISWKSMLWWWQLKDSRDKVDLGLWMSRLLFSQLLFILGLRAPGLPRRLYSLVINEGERDVEEGTVRSALHLRFSYGSTWAGFRKKLSLLLPYMWPQGSPRLQFTVMVCLLLLCGERVVNVFVPIYYKNIGIVVGCPTSRSLNTKVSYNIVPLYGNIPGIGLMISILNTQNFEQNIFVVVVCVTRHTLTHVCFNSGITFFFSTGVTITITEWRTKYRREMNTKDNETSAKAVDSLLNFETVKYYNAESYEVERYNKAILAYQDAEWKTNASLTMLNQCQNVVIGLALLAGALLCAHFVTIGKMNVGDFVLFCTYITQLYIPLNWFGTYYRMIQSSFIDMENMFSLFDEKNEVQLQAQLFLHPSYIFHFHLALVFFHVVQVGSSGAGKSTIMRLLFRFFDVTGGCVRIDGQDISKVSQKSLRSHIGVVPQDTVLFNDTIGNNILYGRVNATEGDLEEAAYAADIHEGIMSFPEGYNTMVGERGLKLSGGEKQRVAIARTILKAPEIILLDEATSALDTYTERNIQASLAKVCTNRTSLVIAHRLSTIIGADLILVLQDGCILERGRSSPKSNQFVAHPICPPNFYKQSIKQTDKQTYRIENITFVHLSWQR
uniref:ATP-binding cassette sub-family B member 6 n=1 Tax=Eptatretus burgeri TaxID=7764 RepID=A0A8C4QZD0_EPTBU